MVFHRAHYGYSNEMLAEDCCLLAYTFWITVPWTPLPLGTVTSSTGGCDGTRDVVGVALASGGVCAGDESVLAGSLLEAL